MLSYRSFRNTDPPLLASLWQGRVAALGRCAPVTLDSLEKQIFSKPYFEYAGLILAFDGDRPLGFAHAGFGPTDDRMALDRREGVICVVITADDPQADEAAHGLVERCEAYLRQQGAEAVWGGARYPLSPFYTGFYGGGQPPGLLESDHAARATLADVGYEPVEQTAVFVRDLATFEAIIDRRQMEIRRQMIVTETPDPPSRNWWEACIWGEFDLRRYDLKPKMRTSSLAHAIFFGVNIDSAGMWPGAGLLEIEISEGMRRRGIATFLITEVCRQYSRQGVGQLEAQVSQSNAAATGLLQKLGFQQVDSGVVYRKTLR
jgi:GNAT superfamily N-acetyltransferase